MKLGLLCATVLVLLGSRPASASSIIYDGGTPLRDGVVFADQSYPYAVAADSFVLQPGATTITDAHWWGGCFAVACSDAEEFTVTFYTDAGNQIGTLIQSYSVGNANQTATGELIANGEHPEYAYSAVFAPLTLAANTTYWFAVSNGGASGDYAWGMEVSRFGSSYQFFPEAGVWLTQGNDLAFNLTGDSASVPEPTSLLMIGIGAVGVLARRRWGKQQ